MLVVVMSHFIYMSCIANLFNAIKSNCIAIVLCLSHKLNDQFILSAQVILLIQVLNSIIVEYNLKIEHFSKIPS